MALDFSDSESSSAYVTSASTNAEVRGAYDDNADYDVIASTTKAKLFIVAARVLLRRTLTQQGVGAHSMSDDPAKIREELERAMAWWRANDDNASGARPPSRVHHFSLENFRQ